MQTPKNLLEKYPNLRCKCSGNSQYAHTLWCPARSWYSVAKTRTVGRAPDHVSKLIQYHLYTWANFRPKR